MMEHRIPTAGAELEAVVEDTERATDSIMAEAERLMGEVIDPDDPEAYKAKVDESMCRIIEACSFQDLTGQRVSKAVTSLKHIEERVTRFASSMGVSDGEMTDAEKAEENRRAEVLTNGPALGGPETDQSSVDDIMGMDQDAIDALFD
jgi:chemotaxis protein CheZ